MGIKVYENSSGRQGRVVQNTFDNVEQVTIEDSSLPISTLGLILHLDAGDSRSYPGSGTTWTDLSGNGNNGDLDAGNMGSTNYSTSDGGYFNFDGTNEYVDVSGSTTVSDATFLAWIRLDDLSQTINTGIIFSRSDTATTGMNLYATAEQVGYHWNDAANTYQWSSGLTVPNQEWCMVALTVTSSVATAYLFRSSGTTSATNTVTHGSTTLDAIRVGADEEADRYLDGSISVATVYNRALSLSELGTNFDAFKGRYGF